MKEVKLYEIAKRCPKVPFFFFESARLRHYLESDQPKIIGNSERYLISSGHQDGLYYAFIDSDVFISDTNFKKYFRNES